jgi:hypothetical protein
MSLFVGKTGLRTQFYKKLYSDIAPATSQATAIYLGKFDNLISMFDVDNSLDAAIQLYLVPPDADSTVATNRLPWIEIDKNRVINLNTGMAAIIQFDPGTQVWVSGVTVPTLGALRIFVW